MKNRQNGISLIVLVITIIIIIILASAVILSISRNNPIEAANEAVFKQDVMNFVTELGMYHTNRYLDNLGNYIPEQLYANNTSITYNGGQDTSKSIYDIITILKDSSKYHDKFEIEKGRLVYIGTVQKEKEWIQELGMEIKYTEPQIEISLPDRGIIKSGNNVKYDITFRSNYPVQSIALENNIILLDEENNVVGDSSNIILIGTPTGTSNDLERKIAVEVITTSLSQGDYRLNIKQGVVTNSEGISNTKSKESAYFTVDNEAPMSPQIAVNMAEWTNQDVIISIQYTEDSTDRLYSFDLVTWTPYAGPIIITGNTIIYAKSLDTALNESAQASFEITKIDKINPNNATIQNILVAEKDITASISISDSQSGINKSFSKYVITTQSNELGVDDSIWNTATSFQNENQNISYTVQNSGKYYIQVLSQDIAGNKVVFVSNEVNVAPYDVPYIPSGFTHTIGTWNTGYVIRDSSSNEFVWVPVPNMSLFIRHKFDGTSLSTAYKEPYIDGYPTEVADYNEMLSSVRKYGGFYIGRYESGKRNGTENVVAIKSNLVPWANIICSTNVSEIGTIGAVYYSKLMSQNYSYASNIVTHLTYGVEWDATLDFIMNYGIRDTAYPSNSASKGNYKVGTSEVLNNTGVNEIYKLNNIYDMAGNVFEWTMEEVNLDGRVFRGGSFINVYSNSYAAGSRYINKAEYAARDLGFRTSLYIK